MRDWPTPLLIKKHIYRELADDTRQAFMAGEATIPSRVDALIERAIAAAIAERQQEAN